MPDMRDKRVIAVLICVAVVAVIVFAKLGTGRRAPERPESEIAPRPARAQVSPSGVQDSLRTVVTAVRPAVVNISAHPRAAGKPQRPGVQLLDPFPVRTAWVGSGLIVDPAGYVLSCRQVTGDAEVVRVTLFRSGKNTFLARRVATDPVTGLVLLKLPFGGDLPYAVLGDSSRVRTGDLVIALGSPFGLSETVTQGIVSASRRTVTVEGRQVPSLIQTDAAIDQGNSGGPLVDIHAEVIGVNIAIYSTGSTFSGIGFAVPSNQARAFLQRAIGFRG
jgi:S1-C subfamily serine protease